MSFQSIATELHPKSYPCSIAQTLPLFKEFNRISYKAATGTDAPEYDSTRDVKLWLDTAAGKGKPAKYKTWTFTAQPEYIKLSIPAWYAKTVNLPPDPVSYPVWNPPPSDAVVMSGGVAVSPIDPFYLATQDQADQLYKELGAVGGVQLWTPDPGPGDIHVQYGEDPRREFQFLFKSQMLTVGLLLKQMYVNGVGAPGAWDLTGCAWDLTGSEPRWIPAPPPVLPPNYKVTPMPMRPLFDFEQWDILPAGPPMISHK
jgi:hypothetical protein